MPTSLSSLLGGIYTGPTGPTGAQGANSTVAGPTGPTGPTGPQGADSTVAGPTGPTGSTGTAGSASPKAISIMDPTAAEDITLFYTTTSVTLTQVLAVLRGAATPSVTYTIRYASDRSAVGTAAVSAATVTNITTGTSATIASASIPANNFVWLETTAVSGTVNELSVTLIF